MEIPKKMDNFDKQFAIASFKKGPCRNCTPSNPDRCQHQPHKVCAAWFLRNENKSGEWWRPYHDLNQIRRLEKTMTDEDWERYLGALIGRTKDSLRGTSDIADFRTVRDVTARQCAEAMVKSGFVKLENDPFCELQKAVRS